MGHPTVRNRRSLRVMCSSRRAAVLFSGGLGKPQLRPNNCRLRRGYPPAVTPAGEQQDHATSQLVRAGTQGGDRMASDFEHRPVMLDEVLETFAPLGAGLFVDATVGGGGHADGILRQHRDRRVLGLDRDPRALEAAGRRLDRHGDRVALLRCRFDTVSALLDDPGTTRGLPFTGALFDLGVSSPQLDRGERGFSHRFDGPLDMRMDPDGPLDAAQVVNNYDERDLVRLLRSNADEPHARRIAAAIVAARPLRSTGELAQVVVQAVPAAARRTGRHPAMRTFQAIRIEVNDELAVIEPALTAVIDRLQPGGRVVVIAYHSGEDRIVKHVLRQAADGVCECPSGLPCICGAGPSVRLLRRKVRRPSAVEVAANPRSASARFRSAERLAVGEY